MYKPLVISRQYLWEKNAVGQIQRVFWEYLYDQGVRPTILCPKTNENDVLINRIKCEVIQTYCNRIPEYVLGLLKRILVDDFAYLPDYGYYSWAKLSAIKRAKYEAISGRYDYIHSVCRSYSSHLIALEAKKKSNLPWIASFYDPWYDNPFRIFKSRFFSERDRKYEASVAANADAILHSNQAIYDEWVNRYGESIKEKMFIVPFVFNSNFKDENNSITKSKSSIFNITHIGTLFKDRDSVDFLKALCKVLSNHPELRERVELNYVGTVTDEDRAFVNNNNLSQITHFWGYLSEKECGKYFEDADLFLAIDGKNSKNIFFPSKIMKYFYYGKPILGLTPSHSALQYELNSSGNFCFNNDDIEGISKFIYRALTEEGFLSGNDTAYWKNFTMESVYPKYEKIVSNLINKNEYNSK